MTIASLTAAKHDRADEFYTSYGDVEREAMVYADAFKGKRIYCNCDTADSAFVRFFADRFRDLGLASLTASCYAGPNRSARQMRLGEDLDVPKAASRRAIALTFDGDSWDSRELDGTGSFDSPECLTMLDACDVVATNPPFTRFGDFVEAVMSRGKDLLALGNRNAVTYRQVFPWIMDGRLWIGEDSSSKVFTVPSYYDDGRRTMASERTAPAPVFWFTTLDRPSRHVPMDLTETYSPDRYRRYDDLDAIEVPRTRDIPKDYDGVMCVPVSYLAHHCPEQFEIVGHTGSFKAGVGHSLALRTRIDGRIIYKRIAIRRIADVR